MGPNRPQAPARRTMSAPRAGPVGGRRCLVVLARWPSPGRYKRRLAAGLGPGGTVLAARIQARLRRHTLAVAQAASPELGGGLVLAVDGLGPGARRRWGQQLGVAPPGPRDRAAWACACSASGSGPLALAPTRWF